jgi:hypothetical protein
MFHARNKSQTECPACSRWSSQGTRKCGSGRGRASAAKRCEEGRRRAVNPESKLLVTRAKAQGETFRYTCKRGVDERGLPHLIEFAFAVTPDGGLRGLHAGLNWSVPLGNPLESDAFRIDGEHIVSGLSALLANQRIDLDEDPVCLAVHLACPRFRYLDRGKGSISLGGEDE